LEVLREQTPQTRKTVLAVLISLFGRNDKTDMFNTQMLQDAKKYNEVLKSQQRTDKQEKNWMSWGDVIKTFQYVYKKAYPLFKKTDLRKKDWLELNDLMMLAVYVLIPPRRSSDFVEMKIRNYTDKDNYVDMKNGELIFNHYKTDKKYGTQSVKMTPKLKTLMKKWIAINPTDYLLFDARGKPLTPSRLTFKMNNVFGKNVSTTLLRHIYITDVVLKDAPKLNDLEDVAQDMGHSVATQATYRVT
jgi:integrase